VSTKGAATRERILETSEALVLSQGYAGTSIDDILAATGLTKGAFFHHFADKAELGRAIVERYAARDFALFEEWSQRADRLSDDPLERTLIFLRLFEEFLDGLAEPPIGCVFASYTYEAGKFGPEMRAYIQDRLKLWQALYQAKFSALLAARKAARPTSAEALAEMIVALIEGGFVLGNAYRDRHFLQRQSAQFRAYLELLFRE
jgi:TetR/AcrR family transcriptional repressor of nem operon